MARPRSEKRIEALNLWLEHGRTIKPSEIAKELGISPELVRKWKSQDKWDDLPQSVPPYKKGAPYRNKNAVGNKGGGAPLDNENAVKHGLYKRWMPSDEEYEEIYTSIKKGMKPIDFLWEDILVSFTNFLRAQKIMFVKNSEDHTITEKKKKMDFAQDDEGNVVPVITEIEYDIHTAADKQAKVLTAQAAASRALTSKLKRYEEMLASIPPEELREEHRLRLDQMRANISATKAKAW